MIKAVLKVPLLIFLLSSHYFMPLAFAEDWQPVAGKENIKRIFTDRQLEATLQDNQKATAIYNADGSGQMTAGEKRFSANGK